MFGKKDEVKESLKKLSQELKEIESFVKEGFSSSEKLMGNISTEISSIKNSQNSYVKDFSADLSSIKKLMDEFETSVKRFEHMQKNITDITTTKLNSALKEQMDAIRHSTDEYSSLKPEVEKIAKKIALFSEEIDKFRRISEKIKEMDFELEKYANKIEAADEEKLRLMRQVDTLKKVIASERRRR
ncbi:MAG: hypothetical protein ABIB71_02490 [Candidatus Woesearchaeota archaeon]